MERLPIAIVVGADMLRRDLDPVREAARGLRLERLRTEVHDVAEFLRRAITSRPQRERGCFTRWLSARQRASGSR